MTTFEFLFYIEIPESAGPLETYRDPLSDVGCKDICVGDGGSRKVSFNLAADGDTLKGAYEQAELAILSAVPSAAITGVLDWDDINRIADRGMRDINEGRYIELNSPDDIARFFDRIQDRVKRRAKWRAPKRWFIRLLKKFLPPLRTPYRFPEHVLELTDPLEKTPPVWGSGEFLRDRGYPNPLEAKEKSNW